MGHEGKISQKELNRQLLGAVEDKDLELVKIYLSKGAKPNLRSKYRRMALIAACDGEPSYEIAKILVDHGANPNIVEKDGYSTLAFACMYGDSKLVKLLLEAGADPNLKSASWGRPPLHFAATNKKDPIKIIKLLVKHGVDVNLVNKGDNNAILD